MNSLVKSRCYSCCAHFADGETRAQVHCHFSEVSHVHAEAHIKIRHLALGATVLTASPI